MAGSNRGIKKLLSTALLSAVALLGSGVGSGAFASGMPPLGMRGAAAPRVSMVGSTGESAAEGVTANTVPAGFGQRYFLRLHHTHTGEDINIVYRIGNTYLPEAIEKLNYFLRDHRTQDLADYDPAEFDLLHTLMGRLHRPAGVIDIVCGYRTPESNNYLRTRSADTGVAEHSQHILSKAIDIQVPGVATLAIRNAALAIGAGGVGYYPTSHFVHVDVGPVREWQFGGRRARYRTATARRHGRGHIHHRRG